VEDYPDNSWYVIFFYAGIGYDTAAMQPAYVRCVHSL